MCAFLDMPPVSTLLWNGFRKSSTLPEQSARIPAKPTSSHACQVIVSRTDLPRSSHYQHNCRGEEYAQLWTLHDIPPGPEKAHKWINEMNLSMKLTFRRTLFCAKYSAIWACSFVESSSSVILVFYIFFKTFAESRIYFSLFLQM